MLFFLCHTHLLFQDHAKPLIDVGVLTVLAKLLDTENVHPRIKTAAASALANITDHDVRHCQVSNLFFVSVLFV